MRVFICYSRSLTDGVSGRIDDHLRNRFGPQSVFRDVDDIPLGEDVEACIKEQMAGAEIVLVVIGPDWTSEARNPHEEGDFIRLELELALRHGLPIVPVFVEGVSEMPRLRRFRRRSNGFEDSTGPSWTPVLGFGGTSSG